MKKNLEKVVCRRCGGSGNFSYNLTRGTVCFGCNGTKFQLIDTKKEALTAQKKKETKAKKRAAYERCRIFTEALANEMNAIVGPFDISSELGYQHMRGAVADKFGKDFFAIRDTRFAEFLELNNVRI